MNATFAIAAASAGNAFSTILSSLCLIYFWFQIGTWNARLAAVDLVKEQNDTTDNRSDNQ
jgi:hypothetical protein